MKEKALKLFNWLFIYSLLVIIFLLPGFFFFKPFTFNVFELPKTELFRCLVFLSLFSFLAISFIKQKINFKISWPVFILILLIALSAFLAAFFSIHPELSFLGSYSRRQGFFQIIFYAIFFLLLLFALEEQNNRKKFFWAAVFSSIIPVIYGLAQFFRFDPMPWAEDFGRVFSTVGQPNFFGHYLILVIPLTIGAGIFGTRRFWPRFFLGILFLAQAVCLYGTLSRAAWLAFLAEFMFLAVFYAWFKKKTKIIIAFFSMIFILAVIGVGVYFWQKSHSQNGQGSVFTARVDSIFDWRAGSGSNRARLNYWGAAISALAEAPRLKKVFGHGPEALPDIFAARYQPEWALDEKIYLIPDRAHNFILDFLLQFGFFGFGAAVLAIIYFLKEFLAYFRCRQTGDGYFLAVFSLSGLFGCGVNNFFGFSLTLHNVFSVFLLALALGAVFDQNKSRIFSWRLSKISRVVLLLFIAAFGAIFVFGRSIKVLAADHQYVLARKFSGPDGCRGLSYLRQAFIINARENQYREEYFGYGADCLKKSFNIEEGEVLKNNLLEVLEQIPEKERNRSIREYEASIFSLAARFNEEFFDIADEKFFQLALDYPAFDSVYTDRAEYLTRQEDYEGAINILLEGLDKAFPKNWNNEDIFVLRQQDVADKIFYFYEFLGNLYDLTGRPDKALEYYERIINFDPRRVDIYKKIADIYEKKPDKTKALWYNKRAGFLNPSGGEF